MFFVHVPLQTVLQEDECYCAFNQDEACALDGSFGFSEDAISEGEAMNEQVKEETTKCPVAQEIRFDDDPEPSKISPQARRGKRTEGKVEKKAVESMEGDVQEVEKKLATVFLGTETNGENSNLTHLIFSDHIFHCNLKKITALSPTFFLSLSLSLSLSLFLSLFLSLSLSRVHISPSLPLFFPCSSLPPALFDIKFLNMFFRFSGHGRWERHGGKRDKRS